MRRGSATISFRSACDCLFEACRCDGVAFCHVCSDAEDYVWFLHVDQWVRHRTASDCGCQTGNRWGVSGTAAVVDVVCTETDADEFLHEICCLARCATGGNAVDTIPAVCLVHLSESLGCAVECLVPACFVEFTVLAANQWGGQPVGVVHESRRQIDP